MTNNIITNKYQFDNSDNSNFYLTIMSDDMPHEINLDDIIETLNKYCLSVNIKRFDESNEIFEASFFVEYDSYKKLIKTQKAIHQLNDNLRFTFLDNNNITLNP